METVPPKDFSDEQEMTSKRLADLMDEYLAIKKVERENVFAEMHKDVRNRVYALKSLLLETSKLDVQFHREVYDLEQKMQPMQDEIYKKRMEIVNGAYQPTEAECLLPGIQMKFDGPAEGQEAPQGIPSFWLTVMKNVHELKSTIQEADEDVLKHLIDIRAFSKPSPELSFVLEFHFSPNEYFENEVLTKTYLMKCCLDNDDPFSFEGPEIYKSIGSEISWKSGKNVMVFGGKKSQHPFFQFESFFNFFSPPQLKSTMSEENEKIESYLETDFEIGHYLKERVVPRAVLFFTGEVDDEMSEDEESFEIDAADEEDFADETQTITEGGDN